MAAGSLGEVGPAGGRSNEPAPTKLALAAIWPAAEAIFNSRRAVQAVTVRNTADMTNSPYGILTVESTLYTLFEAKF
jgi:hypothetical protein